MGLCGVWDDLCWWSGIALRRLGGLLFQVWDEDAKMGTLLLVLRDGVAGLEVVWLG